MQDFRERKSSAFTFSAKVDSKRRITVPARIRDRLGLEKGDKVCLSIDSRKVIRKEVEDREEAIEFIQQQDSVRSFSFRDGVVEVVLDG